LRLPVLLSRLAGRIAFIAPGGFSLRPWLQRLRGVAIGKNVWIAQLVYIDEIHPSDVSIGDNCIIGLRTSIISHFYSGPRRETGNGKVVIEKDVFIGPHCVILPNVRIGEGAVIRASTVVSRNVPPHTFWGPPPAEALGTANVPLTPETTYEDFMAGLTLRIKRPRNYSERTG
jgi:acetyltransferase-like isoleucine patch superfamily enzyme